MTYLILLVVLLFLVFAFVFIYGFRDILAITTGTKSRSLVNPKRPPTVKRALVLMTIGAVPFCIVAIVVFVLMTPGPGMFTTRSLVEEYLSEHQGPEVTITQISYSVEQRDSQHPYYLVEYTTQSGATGKLMAYYEKGVKDRFVRIDSVDDLQSEQIGGANGDSAGAPSP